ncbi:unnamed protein product [Meloidogyne enterolobii]|uniref:Uncharacterized protein n=1 Tax=Meloidogyne enterolobii TaxID=390850 RepID=A0ACB1AA85_MELEN
MSVFNEVKILTASTPINIGNTNNNLSPDFLTRNASNSTIKPAIIDNNVDNNGGEATPTTPVANNSNSSTPNANSRVQQKNPKLYKTELCRSWMETGRCNYGERYSHILREIIF